MLSRCWFESRAKAASFSALRTQPICRQDAEQITRTALEFGQDDDITVLALTQACMPQRLRLTAFTSTVSP